ncbi:protein FAR1-RELATED SEQUENCE 9-like [Bidens hawaiensis]|uniref:protein FAR1-RELATED SEQUENCE 9-like n=1 Tax=Bidens hawaiensis TaxID=980011 RepID=UPI00404B5A7E
MQDFHLTEHEWLTDIYQLRSSWIPAFYRDEDMSGLMQFLAHFDSAIEHQRHEHRKNDHDSRYKSPETWSKFPLEKQAVDIYTKNIFFDVQLEIDTSIHKWNSTHHRHGRMGEVRVFPRRYILRRWTKDVVANSPLHAPSYSHGDVANKNDAYSVVRQMNKAHDHVINQLVGDMEKLSHHAEYINNYKAKVDEIHITAPPLSNKEIFADMLKTTQPTHANIRVPTDIRNKGCGVHNRIRSQREQAISQAGKPRNHCTCGEPGHDSRNHYKIHPEDAPSKRPSPPQTEE